MKKMKLNRMDAKIEDHYVARNWWGINLVICHSQHRIAKFIACDISCTVVQLCHMQ